MNTQAMETQQLMNYERIAKAIEYIQQHFKEQPELEAIAAHVHLSPFHFQRMFTEWTGVSPKKFLQYLSIEYAKDLLKSSQASLFETAHETGLSGTSRLHDLFINIEGMTPGEYKNGGAQLTINYSFAESPFGHIIVASTSKGICYLAFATEQLAAFMELQKHFPNAQYQQMTDLHQQNALFIFTQDWSRLSEIKLHLKGTPFQLKVWEALLKIPMGNLTTYAALAHSLNHPRASRAVGTAIGDNPVAFLIPCHRVIRTNGGLGGYHWGFTRKTAIIGWEAAKTARED
ncbi:AraC family transcriptional regulator of adaptative response/methylated-DNA-[protein]-cysteine methyltransferase [Filimonas zeae]|uniref:methylated-DNA--[protein]-cysteine S-methyltransferase n=1 Tax=Filimonas zeae TaxID=1737353 RepID=A0A917J4V6_9BACT|nr:methylated-DNA--[protein]-cysteine S-methyltransferase [Filimonas zeae]MDR6342317.1 AraC family transcriptional regulator of adaptative response/methylated-DNA-[protein]-cysteine methyltransferase [Filimonas zeae]GGH80848.1 methylated-DNA--protein-cysteine methyltransferase [Filimonas zeae]